MPPEQRIDNGVRVLRRLVLLALAGCVLAAPTWAAPPAGFQPLLDPAAPQWDARLDLGGPGPFTFALTPAEAKDGQSGYRLYLAPDVAVLARFDKGVRRELGRAEHVYAPAAATHSLTLRRRDTMLYVLLDGRRLFEAMDGTYHTGSLAYSVGAASTVKVPDKGYQPVEDVFFTDDFMRTADQQQLGVWRHVGGTWHFYSVIETNPQADVNLSLKSFTLGLTPDLAKHEPAAVVTGDERWDDYEYQASARCRGPESDGRSGFAGILFGWRGPGDGFLLRADVGHFPVDAHRLELVRLKDGKETILAGGTVMVSAEQWYRFGVRVRGSRMQCTFDGDTVFDRVDPDLVGGPIGLWSNSANEVLFDDVRCVTNFEWPFDRARTLAAYGQAEGGQWQAIAAEGDPIAGDPGPRQLAAHGDNARYVLGDPAGSGWRLDTNLTARRAGKVGLLCGWRDAQHWTAAEWDTAAGQLRVLQAEGGAPKVIATQPDRLDPGPLHDVAIDLLTDGRIQVRRDGRLRLRCAANVAAGRLGLFANGTPALFGALRLRQVVPVDTEVEVDNAHFANDPFMLHWASSLADWYPAGGPENNPAWTAPPRDDTAAAPASGPQILNLRNRPRPVDGGTTAVAESAGQPEIFWHKGDFFQAYRLDVPVKRGPLSVLLNAVEERWQPPSYDDVAKAPQTFPEIKDKQYAGDGYGLFIIGGGTPNGRLLLYRRGEKIAEAPLPADLTAVTIAHDGGVTWVEGGDKDLLVYHDPQPLTGQRVALRIASGQVLYHLKCHREGVIDEIFEEAPTRWLQQGQWIITNRFSCTPTWSHMTGMGRGGLSVLWSKCGFSGNTTLEYYAGMRMQSDLAYIYPRPGDFNGTIGCKVNDLFSGLSLLPGAWDAGWTGRSTRFEQAGQTIAETHRDLVPTTRENGGQRYIPVPYIAAGRDVHGAWYYIKGRYVDGHLEGYFDNVKVLDAKAPPLAGDRVAIWTQDNEIVVARVRITYQNKVVPRVLLKRDPVSDPSAPGVSVVAALENVPAWHFDFAGSAQGWQPHDHWRAESVQAVKDHGRDCLLVRDHLPGDTFDAVMPLAGHDGAPVASPAPVLAMPGPVNPAGAAPTAPDAFVKVGDLRGAAELRFDFRCSPATKVNLYLTLNAQRYSIPLTGVSEDSALLPVLMQPAGPALADGQWHSVRLPLEGALRAHCGRGAVTLTDLRFGQFHQGYLLAGFGGNPAGSWYELADFTLVPEVAAGAALTTTPCVLAADGAPLAPKAMHVSIDAQPEGQPAANAPAAVKAPAAGPAWLHVRADLPDGSVSPTAHLPLAVVAAQPELKEVDADQPWDGAPIALDIGDFTPTDGTVTFHPPSGAAQSLTWDQALGLSPDGRQLLIDLGRSKITFTDGQKISLDLAVTYASGVQRTAHIERIYRVSADRLAPTMPVVQGGGLDLDAEQTPLATADPSVTRCDVVDDAPRPGGKSYRITNMKLAGAMSVPLVANTLDLGHCPLLVFDYKMAAPVRADFAVHMAHGSFELGFTDNAGAFPMVGALADATRDGAWHRGQFDLYRGVAAHGDFAPGRGDLEGLSLGDFGYSGEAPGSSYELADIHLVKVVSGVNGFDLSWSAYDAGGIARWRYGWSDSDDGVPATEVAGNVTSQHFRDLAAGLRWFLIQAADPAGNWSHIARVPVLVSNARPSFGTPAPAPGALGVSELTLPVSDLAGAALDPSTIKLTAGDKTVPLKVGDATYDPAAGTLHWRWCTATEQFSGPVADGTKLRIAAQGADFAGNAAPTASWDYTISYAAAKQPPPAPQLEIAGQPVDMLRTFSRTLGRLNANGYGSANVREWDETRRDWVARITPSGTGVSLHPAPLDLEKFPYLSFDYRLTAGVALHLLAYVNNGTWRSVTLNGRSRTYGAMGEAEMVSDGAWHTLCLDLRKMVHAAEPGVAAATARYIVLNEYGSAAAPYWLDNICCFGPSDKHVVAKWVDYAPTGIAAGGARFDAGLAPKPDIAVTPNTSSATFDAPQAGTYVLQAQCRDGAGNVGGAARRVVVVP